MVPADPQILKSSNPQISRILLIRLRQIGDVVFTTPAVAALRSKFPDALISYLVEPAAAPVVAGNPHVNDVIVAPRTRGVSGFRGDWALGRELRSRRYDMAIDFHGGPRASLLTWLSRAPLRIGYEVLSRSWMYTRVVPRPRTPRGRHSVLNQWALLATLDVAPPDPRVFPVEMAVERGAASAVAERIARAGISAGDAIVIVHVSAGNPFRRWPAASFAEVASALAAREPGRRIVVTSGPSDTDAARQVIEGARARLPDAIRDRVVACGDFSLAELRALTDRAALYIGGDSGPMHVAAASHVPIVSLYGPTLPERSAPWRDPAWRAEAVEVGALPCRPCDQRTCLPGDFRCLTRIEPQHVVDAAERMLARK